MFYAYTAKYISSHQVAFPASQLLLVRTKITTIKAVIFDLDGTIAAFNLDYKALRGEVRGYLINMGVPASVVTVNENIFDMLKNTELFMTNAGKPSSLNKEIRREAMIIAEKYEVEAAENTSLLPGAVETLKALKKMGLKIGLCTINSEKSTKHILERFKLSEYFDAVTPRDHVNQVKPNPEHCEAILKALGVAATEAVAVGDSISDMQTAKDLKAIAVGIPTGVSTQEQLINNGANYILTSIIDLPTLVERLNKALNKRA
jgi:phosphoglycolate phosphatase